MSKISHAQLTVGVAQTDITPPVGTYNRCWSAVQHDQETGVHRPLKVCIWVIKSTQNLMLVGMDGHWWRGDVREQACRLAIAATVNTTADKVLLCVSHSYAGVSN